MKISLASSAARKRNTKTVEARPPMQNFQNTDDDYLNLALALAGRALGNVWPNPAVGCVLVSGDHLVGHIVGRNVGHIVGRGWTQPGGRPHAEAKALEQAGAAAKGATAYVSLEPCAHHGQTPPCAGALIAAGVGRVVIATGDPDPRVNGRGARMLEDAGIDVTWAEPKMARAAAALNDGFINKVKNDRPLVTLKLASTLDGRIATPTGESQWITGAGARAKGHLLRAEHDAILVGIGTALADDPELSCRLPGMVDRSPVRVVLDRRLRLPLHSRLVQGAPDLPLWIMTGPDCADPNSQRTEMESKGVVVNGVALDAEGRIDLAAMLRVLAGQGITRLLVEGGSAVATSFLSARLVDHLAWFRAPGLMGGDGLAVVAALGVEALAQMPRFHRQSIEVLGDDVLESYVFQA